MLKRIGIPVALAGAVLLLLSGCGGETGEQEQEMAAEEESPVEEVQEPATTPPDTTAEALWGHLMGENYAENWAHWPGKTPFYEGTRPHGALLSTYLNGTALGAVTTDAATLPSGSIIVKENYMPDSTLAAVTVMYKVDGYDPDNNDWYWLKRTADGTVEAQGRVQGCIDCHGKALDNDFVLTGREH
ncbi:MAG: hypothetical protein GF346_05515 [Candidatus Eisenbacteria bacterium]|nr:hypothetical protein [Candidatus Latescibacterota bacterium]MBD3301886.1 hypothetical protein [Candidatus Eisenbacteria bacterium]